MNRNCKHRLSFVGQAPSPARDPLVALLLIILSAALTLAGCAQKNQIDISQLKIVETKRVGNLDIQLYNSTGQFKQGKNEFVIAFRSAQSQELVDLGNVNVGSTMKMPNMAPMSGSVELNKTDTPGLYKVTGDFGMSGAWHFEVQWDGSAGKGSTQFNSNVQ
jgi:hypothetical protein